MAYLEPTRDSGRLFVSRGLSGPVVMLNLLRFRDTADYSQFPQLAPPSPITGRQAYERYVAHARPHIEHVGSELIFMASGGPALIGPPDEIWDLVMLVRHPSASAFLAFAKNPDYLAGIGHRTAALSDSRLVPLLEQPLP